MAQAIGPGCIRTAGNHGGHSQLGVRTHPVLTATTTGATDILLQWNLPEGNGATVNRLSCFKCGTPRVDTDSGKSRMGTLIDGPTE